MTVEEKRELIDFVCNRLDCENCPCDTLPDAWCKRYNNMSMSEDKIDLAMRQLGYTGIENTATVESNVDHPTHYNNGSIECIDAMVAAYGKEAVEVFCLLNAFKYLWRSEHKNGEEDLEKAIWYLKKRLELVENE